MTTPAVVSALSSRNGTLPSLAAPDVQFLVLGGRATIKELGQRAPLEITNTVHGEPGGVRGDADAGHGGAGGLSEGCGQGGHHGREAGHLVRLRLHPIHHMDTHEPSSCLQGNGPAMHTAWGRPVSDQTAAWARGTRWPRPVSAAGPGSVPPGSEWAEQPPAPLHHTRHRQGNKCEASALYETVGELGENVRVTGADARGAAAGVLGAGVAAAAAAAGLAGVSVWIDVRSHEHI